LSKILQNKETKHKWGYSLDKPFIIIAQRVENSCSALIQLYELHCIHLIKQRTLGIASLQPNLFNSYPLAPTKGLGAGNPLVGHYNLSELCTF